MSERYQPPVPKEYMPSPKAVAIFYDAALYGRVVDKDGVENDLSLFKKVAEGFSFKKGLEREVEELSAEFYDGDASEQIRLQGFIEWKLRILIDSLKKIQHHNAKAKAVLRELGFALEEDMMMKSQPVRKQAIDPSPTFHIDPSPDKDSIAPQFACFFACVDKPEELEQFNKSYRKMIGKKVARLFAQVPYEDIETLSILYGIVSKHIKNGLL